MFHEEVFHYREDSVVAKEFYDMLRWNYRECRPEIKNGAIFVTADAEGVRIVRAVALAFNRGWQRCRSQMINST